MSDFLSPDRKEQMRRLESGEQIVIRGLGGRALGKYVARPCIVFGMVWCKRCQKPCDFEESCGHNAANPGRSRMYIRAECHGETVDVLMTFQQWADNEGKLIEVFDDFALPEPPIAPMTLPKSMPLLLMDREPSKLSKIHLPPKTP